MIVLLVLDGLRPDLVTERNTPWLWLMAREGVACTSSHAAFPTATRINSATLSTGSYPGRHGIVGNELYCRAADPLRAISCADYRGLQAIARAEGGRLLSIPTLAERLAAAGRRMVAVGSGSPGTTYLLNPTGAGGPVLNWAVGWGEEADAVAARLGGYLPESSESLERTDFVLRALEEGLLGPNGEAPDVLAIWVTEPDHAQHAHGLGAEASLGALWQVDRRVERLVADLAGRVGDVQWLITSDHGFSTVSQRVRFREETEALVAALGGDLEPGDVVFAGNGLYLNGRARERAADAYQWLAAREWVGALFVRDDLLGDCPGALPQGAAMGGHARSPEFLYGCRWEAADNANGVPGLAAAGGGSVATHGSASPYDVNNILIAWGSAFRQGVVSEAPCGIMDLAPTALHLLGLPGGEEMDGRVLSELLREGDNPADPPACEEAPGALGARREQVAHYSTYAGHKYLDSVSYT